MIQRAFQQRSGRVIALSRVVLAAIFLLAMWIDPTQPVRHEELAYLLIFAYALASLALLAATWNDWWRDYSLARASHYGDIAVFTVAVYVTAGYTSGFSSPFFTFFVYLIFSATIRWGWRETLRTAAITTSLYVALGAYGLFAATPDFDVHRFTRHSVYFALLSLVMIWFGTNQSQAQALRRPQELEVNPKDEEPPVAAAARYAADRTGAHRAVFLWWEKEEPWINVARLEGEDMISERYGPAELGQPIAGLPLPEPFLFDRNRHRSLFTRGGNPALITPAALRVPDELLARFGLAAGLAVPINSRDYEGQMFLLETPGLCCDDLALAKVISEEISAALDRYSMMTLHEKAAVSLEQGAIARDLHDSVAQVLAGACFRLEALRSWVRAGKDPDAEIDAIQEALRAEQRNIRSLIARLRGGSNSSGQMGLAGSLNALAEELSRQWDIECVFSGDQEFAEAPAWMLHELRQLAREGAANAVRHGRCRKVSLTLATEDGEILLSVTGAEGERVEPARGGGEEEAQAPVRRPWSIHERVKKLGGTLSLTLTEDGSRLSIVVPQATKA
jgi:signal transduction histidine kinase